VVAVDEPVLAPVLPVVALLLFVELAVVEELAALDSAADELL
jgi:hypothetical protein